MTRPTHQFNILHIDPMGQGVSKQDDQIFFIPKTLPGEHGQAKVIKKSKGVHFAEVLKLESESNLRIKPECIHYNKCQGCQFLHCDYSSELEFKKQSLSKLLGNFDSKSINIIPSKSRFGYRNRMQLHYDLRTEKIGLINRSTRRIEDIPHCQLPNPQVARRLQELTANGSWKNDLPLDAPSSGHLEIYDKDGDLQVHYNETYAQGGFTQVNPYINQKMHERLHQFKAEIKINTVLDLFGGQGNLSEAFTQSERLVVDFYPGKNNLGENFLHFDLYQKDALKLFCQTSPRKTYDLIILDPPRSGLKEIGEWLTIFRPESALYISCNPATLARDLKQISGYALCEVSLFDMFPGTHHYETLVWLKRL